MCVVIKNKKFPVLTHIKTEKHTKIFIFELIILFYIYLRPLSKKIFFFLILNRIKITFNRKVFF